MWEEGPASILRAYERTFELEAKFHQEGRYVRIFGNHDDLWEDQGSVKRHLEKVYGGRPLKVRESLVLRVMDGSRQLGTLFLVHGHQGDVKSDRWAGFSKGSLGFRMVF